MTDCPEYNRDLLDPMVPTLRMLVKITIVLGVVLDLLIFKYRKMIFTALHMIYYIDYRNLANLILYFETISSAIYTMIPARKYLELTGF